MLTLREKQSCTNTQTEKSWGETTAKMVSQRLCMVTMATMAIVYPYMCTSKNQYTEWESWLQANSYTYGASDLAFDGSTEQY